MSPEVYEVTVNAVLEIAKILGPAIITAIVGFRAGQLQLKQRIYELEKGNEYKARETIFNFHREKLEKTDESLASLNSAMGTLSGMALADQKDEKFITQFVSTHLTPYIQGLEFNLSHVYDELLKHKDHLPREIKLISGYLDDVCEIVVPTSHVSVQETIVKLIEIYGHCSHCIRCIVELEALDIFSPYTNNS